MDFFRKFLDSPIKARLIPYVLFVGVTWFQGKFGPESHYWFYLAKTFLGILLVWIIWPLVKEMRWAFSWEAVVVGVAVFIMWIGIDPWYPHLIRSEEVTWNAFADFASAPAVAWFCVVARIAGSTLIVPLMEEAFFRSFFYRWIVKQDFLSVPLNHFGWKPFLITAVIFGSVHNEWLAGILCGMAYQWLVLRKNRLGDAITAHAITNLLLGIWVVWKGAWQFW